MLHEESVRPQPRSVRSAEMRLRAARVGPELALSNGGSGSGAPTGVGAWQDDDDPMSGCAELLDSVENSLLDLIDGPVVVNPDGDAVACEGTRGVRSTALQAAMALQQLQANMARELQMRQQLECAIAHARRALKEARLQLECVRADEQHARYVACHDPLTALPNRGFFNQRLVDALAANPPLQDIAVFFVDLDGFKPINDTHGHAVGDEMLRIVAARFVGAVRAADTVCRMGGDEFACVMCGLATRELVEQQALKLAEVLQRPCKIGPHTLRVGASIGVAVYPSGGMSPEELLIKADLAMYRAKRDRTGYAFYDGAPAD